MFGSTVVAVVLGLVFVYFVFSMACSKINEVVSARLQWRADTLEKWLRKSLDPKGAESSASSATTADKLKSSSLVTSVTPEGAKKGLPSYLALQTFSLDEDVAVDIAEFTRQLRDELRVLFGHEPLLYSGWDYAKQRLASIDSDIWVTWYPKGDGSFDTAQNRWHEVVDGQAELGRLRPVAWQYAGDVKDGVPGVGSCDASIAPGDQFASMLIPAFQPQRRPGPRPSVPSLGAITAANGRTVLTMQDDGNLVVYGSSAAVWDSKTSGPPGARLECRTTGTS